MTMPNRQTEKNDDRALQRRSSRRRCTSVLVCRMAAAVALFAAIVALGSTAARAQDDDSPEELATYSPISSSEMISCWAADAESGHLFGSLAQDAKLVEFNLANGQEVRRMNPPATVDKLYVKSGRLIANMPSRNQLLVIDLETHRPLTTITLEAPATDLFSADADAQHFYAISGTRDQGLTVSKFDVTDGSLVKSAWLEKLYAHATTGTSMPGGSGLFLRTSFAATPQMYRLSPNDLSAELAFSAPATYETPRNPVDIAPSGRWWEGDGSLYPVPLEPVVLGTPEYEALARSIREYQIENMIFHPSLDLVGGITYENRRPSLTLRTFSDASSVGKYELPGILYEPYNRGRFGGVTLELIWVGSSYALVMSPRSFVVLDLQKLDVKRAQTFYLQMPPGQDITVGQPLKLQMRASASGDDPVTFSKYAGPEGLTVSETGLVEWTPGVADVGKQVVKVRGEAGDQWDRLEFMVEVSRPVLSVNGIALKMSINPAGTHAVIGCARKPDPLEAGNFSLESYVQEQQGPIEKLVLIDLATMQVIAERELETRAMSVCITDDACLVGHAVGGKVVKLNLDDLSEADRAFVGSPPVSMDLLGEDLLIVSTFEGGTGVKLSDMSLTPLPGRKQMPDSLDGGSQDFEQRQYARLSADSALLRGTVVDPQLNVRMITELAVAEIPAIFDPGNNGPNAASLLSLFGGDERTRGVSPQPGVPHRWSRIVNYYGLYDTGGMRLGSWTGYAELLSQHPVAGVVRMLDDAGEEQQQPYTTDDVGLETNLWLELHDLKDGSVLKKIPLGVTKYRQTANAVGRDEVMIRDANNRVFVAVLDQVYDVQLEDDEFNDAYTPLRVVPQVQPLRAEVGETVEIPLSTEGGEGDVRYRLRASAPSLQIDADSGTVTVDTGQLWNTWLNTDIGASYITRFDRGFGPAQQTFGELFDEPTSEIPFRVPLDIIATDASGTASQLRSQLLVLAPMSEWEAREEAREAEWERERERAAAERERLAAERAANTPPPAPTNSPAAGGDTSRMSADLSELESRLDELAAETSNAGLSPDAQTQLDRVDRQLDEIRGSLASLEERGQGTTQTLLLLAAVMFVIALVAGIGMALLRRRGR